MAARYSPSSNRSLKKASCSCFGPGVGLLADRGPERVDGVDDARGTLDFEGMGPRISEAA
jgi:hypothetical protein